MNTQGSRLRRSTLVVFLAGAVGIIIGVVVAGPPGSISFGRTSPTITIAADRAAGLGERPPTTIGLVAPAIAVPSTSITTPTTIVTTETSTTTTSTTSTSTAAPTAAPTTTTAAVEPDGLRPRAEIRVFVANGSLRDGVATTATRRLRSLGYTQAEPGSTATAARTIVYAAPGYEAEAARLIADLGLIYVAIAPAAERPDMDPAVTASVYLVLGREVVE